MNESARTFLPFNSPLETGLRSVNVLVEAYPAALDLQRLVAFDHLVVHTGDIGGPDSLHPALPMRAAELLVRRRLVERGLLLMASRGLIVVRADANGILYEAAETAETFLDSLSSPYLTTLRACAKWVVEAFGELREGEFRERMRLFFGDWVEQFQVAHRGLVGEP